jgi:hypothetical protein
MAGIANPGTSNEGEAPGAGQWMAPLSADLVHFFENAGVMKAAVDAAVTAGR